MTTAYQWIKLKLFCLHKREKSLKRTLPVWRNLPSKRLKSWATAAIALCKCCAASLSLTLLCILCIFQCCVFQSQTSPWHSTVQYCRFYKSVVSNALLYVYCIRIEWYKYHYSTVLYTSVHCTVHYRSPCRSVR